MENMGNQDTINLLKECNAGIKMGVSSIDEVMPTVKSGELKKILELSRHEHGVLGDKTHELLLKYGGDTAEPHLMAKGMSWLKTNVKLQLEPSDKNVAGIMTDGCNMGIKSLNSYLNQYKDADGGVKNIAEELIDIEERMTERMKEYL